MKKFLIGFFATLGVIFFILIVICVYLFVADPYNIKPFLFGSEQTTQTQEQAKEVTQTSERTTPARETVSGTPTKNPILNQNQEAALEAVGIDPTDIPSQISPQQESCFEDALGVDRVKAIKSGGTPSAAEIFAARNCL